MPSQTFIRAIMRSLFVLWAAAVAYASLKAPSLNPPSFFLDFKNSDKLVHFIMYFGFCFWLFYSNLGWSRKRRYIISLLISVLYGIAMEIMQEIMAIGRSMDIWDAAANTVGAACFLLASPQFDRILGRLFPGAFSASV